MNNKYINYPTNLLLKTLKMIDELSKVEDLAEEQKLEYIETYKIIQNILNSRG